MILVVAGLHERPFDRLIRVAAAIQGDETMIVQRGSSRVEVPGASTFESLGSEPLARAYRDARIIIGQASPGVLFDALAVGKRPVLMARRPELGEHVDDHQVQFARFVADRATVIWEGGELTALLQDWDEADHRCPPVGIDQDVVRTVGEAVERVAKRRATISSLLRGFLGR